MTRTRPLVSLDVETSGLDPVADRIVEIAIVTLDPFGKGNPDFVQRFNPGRPIPAEATAIHGITDADVKSCPKFADKAAVICEYLAGVDYCGYSLRRLDLPIIDEELRRCGLKLPLDGARIFDCHGIWSRMAPKTLEAAVRLFCGREHEGSHGALADAQATLDVLHGQLAAHPELAKMPEAELAKFSAFGDHEPADLAGKLYRDKDGDLRYSFGKSKDVKVRDDTGYANWMLTRASFPGNTNDVLEAELDRLEAEPRGNTLYPDGPGEPF